MPSLIEVKHLKKYFKVPAGINHAVDDVSFSIEKGETLGVVGESGCGKSTLGRTLIRLQEATEGEILLNGTDITHVRGGELRTVREQMQIVFQDPYSSLNPRMRIESTIMEPLKRSGRFRSRSELRDEASRLMDLVGVDERLRRSYPHELDGGRRQRIGIGRALIMEPAFVVCDEPVSALDVSIQAQILNLLMDLQDSMNLTYLFITHDLSVVKHISDEIMVMYRGKCVEQASSAELFRNPLHPYTRALLAAIPDPSPDSRNKKRTLLQGEVASPVNPGPGCRFAARCPFVKGECRTGEILLKEVGPGHYAACPGCLDRMEE